MDKNSAALVKKLQSELEAYQNLQKCKKNEILLCTVLKLIYCFCCSMCKIGKTAHHAGKSAERKQMCPR